MKAKRRRSLPKKSSVELRHLEVDGLLGALQDKIEDLRDEFNEKQEAFKIDSRDYEAHIDDIEGELAAAYQFKKEDAKKIKALEAALKSIISESKDRVSLLTHPNYIVREFAVSLFLKEKK